MNATIERLATLEAYPRNGNFHNPTKSYRFGLRVDGKLVLSHTYKKQECIDEARSMGVTGKIPVVDAEERQTQR